jgi:hypothetical protein
MAAFVRTNIPTSVDTVEKLLLWALEASNLMFAAESKVIEYAGTEPQNIIKRELRQDTNGVERIIYRASLPVIPEWTKQIGTSSYPLFWTVAKPINTVAIPTGFLATS